MKAFYQKAFWTLAFLGKPFGGIRPHRIMHWIAHRGFGRSDVVSGKTYQVRSAWGLLKVHPFYHLDREVIVSGCYDRPLHRFLAGYVKRGMIVLDVGANIGEVTIHMSKLTGPEGRVYAFEPAPTIVQRLRENVALNALEGVVRISEAALSAETGESLFSFAGIDMENQGMGSLVNRANDVVSKEVVVNTLKLDDFVSREGLKNIALAKVDIQGGEIGFLEGGARTLQEFSPDLVMEVSPSDLLAMGKKPSDLLRMLEWLGYRTYAFGKNGPTTTEVRSETVDTMGLSLNVFCTRKTVPIH